MRRIYAKHDDTYVGNIGDENWVEHGGTLVWDIGDGRLEIINTDIDPDSDTYDLWNARWFVDAAIVERMTEEESRLEWWGEEDRLNGILGTVGMDNDAGEREFFDLLDSDNPLEVAQAYQIIASTWGWLELGADTAVLNAEEMIARFGKDFPEIVEDLTPYEDDNDDEDY